MALSKQFVSFFKDLSANNNREWFHENKKRYEQHVKAPFEALTGEVIERMKKLDPEITVTPNECVFRIYRDVRFSKDKSPYKTHMAAAVGRGGRKDHSYPGVYFQADGEGVSIAGGCWQPDKDRLYRIRAKIAEDPKRFQRILNGKKFKETFKGLEGERNKVIPKEFREVGEQVPEIYNKSFHYWTSYKGQKHVTRDDLAKFIVDHYKTAKAFNEFLIETL
ncbi:MAG: DUF2461 domain-containing protein [Saprospiraceae bacterium]|nr:DUF2461 domain-containing protein [Saprospiraceae bacterium]